MSEETIQLSEEHAASGSQIRLDVTAGPHAGMSWTFANTQNVVLGRLPPAHLRLVDEAAISRQHLELRIAPPRVELMDLESSNGTRVNGIRVLNASLADGDCISIGSTEIRVSVLAPSRSPSGSGTTEPTPKVTDVIEHTRFNPGGRDRSLPLDMPDAGTSDCDPAPLAVSSLEMFSKTRHAELASAPDGTANTTAGNFPARVGVYNIIRMLGQGGMATVHLAEHRRTGERFAIKLIRADIAATDKHVRLFAREAGLITRMNHPRIVRAFEFGIDGAMPYLVMEFLDTIDLLMLLEQQTPSSRIKIATWVTSRILQAVHYAHAQGIVHRDIKPGNVLAYREGRHLQIKIADFGLAKTYEDAGWSALTNERSVRGTVAYMAPEQFRNSRDVAPDVDLFACGACLYRMLTNMIPNMISKPDETLDQLDRCDDLPMKLRDLVRKSIHRDPQHRFASAEKFAEAIFPYHRRV